MSAAEGLMWRSVAVTKRGASHERKDLENQDSVGVRTADRDSTLIDSDMAGQGDAPIVADGIAVAVADGHGSATSFRSAQGALFAVEACLELVGRMLQPDLAQRMRVGDRPVAIGERQQLAKIEEEMVDTVGKAIVRQWTERASEHHDNDPFHADELDHLAAASGLQALDRLKRNPLLAYGSTLLGAVATPGFVAFLQLGDGDIVVVDDELRASRPIAADPALLGNETTSLCLPQAWRGFRFRVEEPSKAPFVLLSTDGLANSYTDEENFLLFGRDVANQMRVDGPRVVRNRMVGWLEQISAQGSGDDITVGLLTTYPEPGPRSPRSPVTSSPSGEAVQ